MPAGQSEPRPPTKRKGRPVASQATSLLRQEKAPETAANDQPEAEPATLQEEQSIEEKRDVGQAQIIWQRVKEYTEEERADADADRVEAKTQMELLEVGFGLFLKWGRVGEQLTEYRRLKNILAKQMEVTVEMNTKTAYVSVQHDAELPKFSGKFGDWQDFVDAFRVKVADKKHLLDAEKFLKLQQCLKTEARGIIAKYSLQNENPFEKSWKRLNEHYNNSYEAFRDHVRRVVTAKEVPHGNADMARKVIGRMEASLERLKAAVKPEDIMSHTVAVQLVSLMDCKTREQWTLHRSEADKVPLLEEVTEFYLTKIKAWNEEKTDQPRENGNGRYTGNLKQEPQDGESDRKQENSRKRSYHQMKSGNGGGEVRRSPRARKLECYCCQEAHPVAACKRFAKESVESRNKLAKEKNLCQICYSAGHSEKGCVVRCYECDGKHIVALCPKK